MIRFCPNCRYYCERTCMLYGKINTLSVCAFHDFSEGALKKEAEFNLKLEGTEMEDYVVILESLISELIGVLKGDVKNPDHIKKLCESAKQFVTEEQGRYFTRVANNCSRLINAESENTPCTHCRSRMNANINYLASRYMEVILSL